MRKNFFNLLTGTSLLFCSLSAFAMDLPEDKVPSLKKTIIASIHKKIDADADKGNYELLETVSSTSYPSDIQDLIFSGPYQPLAGCPLDHKWMSYIAHIDLSWHRCMSLNDGPRFLVTNADPLLKPNCLREVIKDYLEKQGQESLNTQCLAANEVQNLAADKYLPGLKILWKSSFVVQALAANKYLTKLDLSKNFLSESVCITRYFINLKSLNLSRNQINSACSLDFLKNLTQLTYLNLAHNGLEGNISTLAPCTNLTDLTLTGNRTIGAHLSTLAPLTNLRRLYISCSKIGANISALAPLKNLEVLDVFFNNIQSTVDLSFFTNFMHLKTLNMSKNKLGQNVIALTSLTKLTELNLHENWGIKDETRLTLQSSLKNLKDSY